jgi:hypothetical protein
MKCTKIYKRCILKYSYSAGSGNGDGCAGSDDTTLVGAVVDQSSLDSLSRDSFLPRFASTENEEESDSSGGWDDPLQFSPFQ